ncbi:hypothetical protein Pint_04040 [Pistacia integerrima]|uniref:Uncharacterized protein n=1 Tax=Pistacia integerrima TaxID=434235 RepID=A0ACC0Z957_9ROSI|nr:hypothetical protein Pint_04040 [Pistacia integerrima]
MMNHKFNKSQILMLFLLAALLFITPLLSSSLRPTYLYIITNLLIVALGAEAGLLSVFFSKPPLEDKKPAITVASKSGVVVTTPEASSHNNNSEGKEKKGRVVEKSASEKIPRGVKVERVRKCPSTPSLFFIGNGETDHQAEEQVGYEKFYEEEEEEVDGGLSGQELYNKAENFIGNFYKQLKMQREESWKRIHGFYQKAF